jgi:hypothetical protein
MMSVFSRLLVISFIFALPVFCQQTSPPANSSATASGKTSGAATTKKPSKTPSVAETLDWIKDKVASESGYRYTQIGNGFTVVHERTYRIESISGCGFTLIDNDKSTNYIVNGQAQPDDYETITTVIDMSKLRSDVRVASFLLSPDIRVWGIDAHVEDPKWNLSSATNYGGRVTETKPDTGFGIGFASQDVATRVGKAFSDAIVKCGGKNVKEIY